MRKITHREGEIMGAVRAMRDFLHNQHRPQYLKEEIENICELADIIILKVYKVSGEESETNE
jgi:hypothetical protein